VAKKLSSSKNKARNALRAIAEGPETDTLDPTPPPEPDTSPDYPGEGLETTEPTPPEKEDPGTPTSEADQRTPEEQARADIDALIQSCTHMVQRLLTAEDAIREIHSRQKLAEQMFLLLMQHTVGQQTMPGMSPITGTASPLGVSQHPRSGPENLQISPQAAEPLLPNQDEPVTVPPQVTPVPTPYQQEPPPAPAQMPQEPEIGGSGPLPQLAYHPEYQHHPSPAAGPDPSQPFPGWIPVLHNPSSADRPRGCGHPAYFLTRVFDTGEPADLSAMRIKPPGEPIWRAPNSQGEAPVCSACGTQIDPWSTLDLDFGVLRAYQAQVHAYTPQPQAPELEPEPYQNWSSGMGQMPGYSPRAGAQVQQAVADLGAAAAFSRAPAPPPPPPQPGQGYPPPPPLNPQDPAGSRPVRSAGRSRP
jgi:hypothetical protein